MKQTSYDVVCYLTSGFAYRSSYKSPEEQLDAAKQYVEYERTYNIQIQRIELETTSVEVVFVRSSAGLVACVCL